MNRTGRIVAVTAGLSATGAVFGAACAVAAAALAMGVTGGLGFVFDRAVLGFTLGVGAAVGAVVAPPIAWAMLRRVPLGKAVGWSAVGTILGGALGLFLPSVVGPIVGAIAGCVTAGGLLRRRYKSELMIAERSSASNVGSQGP
jgi:hypothetical protein